MLDIVKFQLLKRRDAYEKDRQVFHFVNCHRDAFTWFAGNDTHTNKNTSCTNTGKDKHQFHTYGFNIPSGTVQGIEVRLDARADSTTGSPKICVELSWNGGASWTAVKSTPTLTTAEVTYILGGAADNWGRAWTLSEFSNTNFRVRITDVASNNSRDFFLDYIAVNVTYLP